MGHFGVVLFCLNKLSGSIAYFVVVVFVVNWAKILLVVKFS